MSIIRWEAPPQRRYGNDRQHPPKYAWTAIGKTLKRRLNRWALVALCDNATLAGSTAHLIRGGEYVDLLTLGEFDAVARTVDGEYRVYARYVGAAS